MSFLRILTNRQRPSTPPPPSLELPLPPFPNTPTHRPVSAIPYQTPGANPNHGPETYQTYRYKDLINSDKEAIKVTIDSDPKKIIDVIWAIKARRKRHHPVPSWHGSLYVMKDNVKIDLLESFHLVHPSEIKPYAIELWCEDDSWHSKVEDRQSTHYQRQSFALFLENSTDSAFMREVESTIPESESVLINDGPYLWLLMMHKLFPNVDVFRLEVSEEIKTLTLASFNNDLLKYVEKFRKLVPFLGKDHNPAELLRSFMREIVKHSDVAKQTFTQAFVEKFSEGKLSDGSDANLTALLDKAHNLASVLQNKSLSLGETLSSAVSPPENPMLEAMIGHMKESSARERKMLSHMAKQYNQIQNQKRDFKRFQRRASRDEPPWVYDAPADINETREYADQSWHWCIHCPRWTCNKKHTSATCSNNPNRESKDNRVPHRATGQNHSQHQQYRRNNRHHNHQNRRQSFNRNNRRHSNDPTIHALQAQATKQNESFDALISKICAKYNK